MMLRNLSILIYADTAALQDAARTVAADPRLARNTIEVRGGGMAEAAAWLGDHRSPDVLVVGDSTDEGLDARLERLAQSVEAGCKVIVVGRKDSIAVYRHLTAQGVADYLGGTVRPQDLFESFSRLYATDTALPKGKVVACLGTAGGAGGSTVATVLAAGIAERMGDTALLDLDLAMGTAALLLGADVRDSVASAMANAGLDIAMLERVAVREKRVRVLSTAGSLRDAAAFDADNAERAVEMARTMAKALIVDLPKGWSPCHERLLTTADEVVLVSTPDLAALRNTRMVIDHLAATRTDGAAPKVVINKTGMSRTREYRADELKEALGVRPAGLVPWDPDALIGALADGKPITSVTGKAMTALRQFAATVLPGGEPKNGRPVSPAGLLPSLKTLFVKPA
jgi:pilus assembly protein CpaE